MFSYDQNSRLFKPCGHFGNAKQDVAPQISIYEVDDRDKASVLVDPFGGCATYSIGDDQLMNRSVSRPYPRRM